MYRIASSRALREVQQTERVHWGCQIDPRVNVKVKGAGRWTPRSPKSILAVQL